MSTTDREKDPAVLLPPSALELLHQRPCYYHDKRRTPVAEREVVVAWHVQNTPWQWWILEGDPDGIEGEGIADWYLYALVAGPAETGFGYLMLSSMTTLNRKAGAAGLGSVVRRVVGYTQDDWKAQVNLLREEGHLGGIP